MRCVKKIIRIDGFAYQNIKKIILVPILPL